jgi:hypothetical protein
MNVEGKDIYELEGLIYKIALTSINLWVLWLMLRLVNP